MWNVYKNCRSLAFLPHRNILFLKYSIRKKPPYFRKLKTYIVFLFLLIFNYEDDRPNQNDSPYPVWVEIIIYFLIRKQYLHFYIHMKVKNTTQTNINEKRANQARIHFQFLFNFSQTLNRYYTTNYRAVDRRRVYLFFVCFVFYSRDVEEQYSWILYLVLFGWCLLCVFCLFFNCEQNKNKNYSVL